MGRSRKIWQWRSDGTLPYLDQNQKASIESLTIVELTNQVFHKYIIKE
ncbi:MAG: hypothetical protein F6K23_07110 [Okeania sp. SIO2C9]|nr:hypothetical protein [Okeania sp. SIO2C9]NEQ72860.1 hypothetical protein [Okeania sp. SIO2C9]